LSLFWLPITCENGAFYNASCPESPEDVLRFGSVLQDEMGVSSSNEGAASYEEKLGVRFMVTVQSHDGAIGEVDRTTGTRDSRRERTASDFDCRGSPEIAIASAWAVSTKAAKTLDSSTTCPVFGPSA
jgi:hypothetical protein